MREVIKSLYFVYRQWARADQAHFAAHDIDQLWKFVDAEPAKDPPDRSNARILGELKDGPVHFIENGQFLLALLGIGDHGPELKHGERPAVKAAALLAEEDRPRRSQANGQSGAQEE